MPYAQDLIPFIYNLLVWQLQRETKKNVKEGNFHYQVTSLQGSWNVMRDIAATVTRPTENLIQNEWQTHWMVQWGFMIPK